MASLTLTVRPEEVEVTVQVVAERPTTTQPRRRRPATERSPAGQMTLEELVADR